MALALERMLESDLYFCLVYCLWQVDDVYNEYTIPFFKDIPWLLRPLIQRMVRKDMLAQLHGQVLCRCAAESTVLSVLLQDTVAHPPLCCRCADPPLR